MTISNTLYTVAVFSENRVGLLNQISIIFTRRKLNIETLTVSPSSIKGVHKFTITAYTDLDTKLAAQARDERVDRALPTVRERTHHALCVGEDAPHALRRGVARGDGREASLERIDRDCNFHSFSTCASPA